MMNERRKVPEPKIITDLTFPIEGFGRVAGWQSEFASMSWDATGGGYIPRLRRGLRPANEKLADFGSDGWKFTEHEINGDYRPSRTVATLRDGTRVQRWKGNV